MKQTISEARVAFGLYQRSQGYAHNTIISRDLAVRQLQQELGDLVVYNIREQHITAFMLAMQKRRGERSLVNTHSHMSVFFKWCVNTGRIKPQNNPMNGRRRPKFVEKERQRLHVSKFPLLLETAERQDPRDRALVAVGLFALLRDQEMARLRITDVDLDAGYLFARITKSRLEDRVPISAALDSELRRWFVEYQRQVGALKPEYMLFPRIALERTRTENGFGPSRKLGYDTMKPLNKTGRVITPILGNVGMLLTDPDGEPTREGAHTLRRSGARALYDALVGMGRPDALRIVQTLLHHRNVVETQHYIGLNPDRETRDTIMKGAVLYGFETVSMIGGSSDGEGEALDLDADVRRMLS